MEDLLMLKTLKALSRRKDFVIKPADKNIGLTVLSPPDYHSMCMVHLADSTTYERIQESNYNPNQIFAKLRMILNKHGLLFRSNETLTKLASSLLQLQGTEILRLAVFYCLPKLHKNKIPIPGRPIASCINTVTYYASRYVDHLLQPVRKFLPSVCFSSSDFLIDISDLIIPPDHIIICADVASLYPSIPTNYGLDAVKCKLKQINELESLFSDRQISLICDLLRWILENNFLSYEKDIYRQIQGTAMGTPTAVAYADLTLAFLEQPCLDLQPLLYKRYIDDLFIIAPCDSPIIEVFNSQCNAIQVTDVTKGTHGVFLDLHLSIVGGHLISNLYQKPINRYLYIPMTSAHPVSVFKNLVIAELKRYRLNCSQDEDYIAASNQLYLHLFRRGYSHEFLTPLFNTIHIRQVLLDRARVNRMNRAITHAEDQPIIIFTVKPPNKRIRLPWQRILEFSDELKAQPLFQQVILPRKIIIGRRNMPTSAAFLAKHRDHLAEFTESTEQRINSI